MQPPADPRDTDVPPRALRDDTPGADDLAALPQPGTTPVRVRPPARTLMDRLRQMQSQDWN